MKKEYKLFFKKLKKLKIKQQEQKQRGLNDYNILTTVLRYHDEVRVHSRMIASFLDVNGFHYQGTLFLEKFLEVLEISDYDITKSKLSLEHEHIDLYLTDGRKHIIIENKIWAGDQEKQIQRYIETIQKENSELNPDNLYVIYLSIDRKQPSEYSLGDFLIDGNYIVNKNSETVAHYKSMHYQNHILKWLQQCQNEVQNITNLNEVFKQYIDVVKMVNGDYKGKVIAMDSFIKQEEEKYQMAMEVYSEMPRIREEIVTKFFSEIKFILENKLGDEWKVIIEEEKLKKRYNYPFRIYKTKWQENSLIFGYEFNENEFFDGYFGIVKRNDKIDIQEIADKFKQRLEKLEEKDIVCQVEKWWLYWEWMPDNEDTSDFTKYILFSEHAQEKIVDRMINLIDIFEIKSNLISDINKFLEEKD